MKVPVQDIADAVGSTLRTMPLRPTYLSEERDLHPHIQEELDRVLSTKFSDPSLITTLSVGGTQRPHLKLLGTSFWLDLAITQSGEPLIGVEAKLIRKGASGPIAQALGQALVYSCVYPKAFVFVVHSGVHNVKLAEYDDALTKKLEPINVDLIVRRTADTP